MEQSSIANKQQEEPLAVEANIQQTTENASDATQGKTKTTAPDETTRPEKPHINQNINLLYGQCLGFIPSSQGKEIQDIYMQSFQKIIRNLILHMRTYCKFLRRPTSSNTWKSCRYQSQIKASTYISAQNMLHNFS